ncbi:MAG: GGDEF domain-containing protein [Pseudomonadota bacterium]
MKVNGPNSISQASAVKRSQNARAATSAARASSSAPVSDTASVMGIPEDELTPRVKDAVFQLMAEVESLRREVQVATQRVQELERLADLDPLAPIANRRAFVRELSRVMSYAQRYSVPASILFFDVNEMKRVNDEFGHAAGDAVLLHVANTLIENVRGSDVVGRLGGDEFAVLLANANEAQSMEKGETLVHQVAAKPVRFDGGEVNVSVAVGAYTFRSGESPTDVLEGADRKMYANKRQTKSDVAEDGGATPGE